METVFYDHPYGKKSSIPYDPDKTGGVPTDYGHPVFSGSSCFSCRNQLKGVVMNWWELTGCPVCYHSFVD